jgi:hypothetical protein
VGDASEAVLHLGEQLTAIEAQIAELRLPILAEQTRQQQPGRPLDVLSSSLQHRTAGTS